MLSEIYQNPPFLNHNAHHTAMECLPNFFGTWIAEKPFKKEIGTVLKWSWQHVVRFLFFLLDVGYYLSPILPSWNHSGGRLKSACGLDLRETVAANDSECLFLTCLKYQRGAAEGFRWCQGCCQSHGRALKCFSRDWQKLQWRDVPIWQTKNYPHVLFWC